MDCEIIQINEKTWRIEDGGVRLFLLAGSERALLIDSGMNLETARDVASGLTGLPLSLLMLASGLRFAMNVLSSAAKPAMTENVLLF